jgi:hypothetical protein
MIRKTPIAAPSTTLKNHSTHQSIARCVRFGQDSGMGQ